jgi:uncharacterized protein (TIGR03435 family)
MKAFAQMLSGILGQLAVDQTELSGVFEIAVDWTMNEDIPVPGETEDTIFKAVEAQLGLKLEQKKMPLEVLIVDHADKCRPGINQ